MAIDKEQDDLSPGSNHDASEEDVKLLQGGETAKPEVIDENDDEDDEHEASAKRDTELESAADDAEREAIRERRRADRRNKNQRQRDKIDALMREKETLRAQLASLSERVSSIQDATLGQSLAALDQEIARAKQAANHFSNIAADAVAKQDGKTWREASERATFANNRLAELNALKTNVAQGMQRQQTQPTPANPIVAKRATDFMGRHQWYGGVQSNDLDSRVVTQLDSDLTAAGWDPTTDAYWQELESRMGKELPHRMQRQGGDDDQRGEGARKQPKQPVAGANGGQPASGKGASYQLSTARVQALKDAGLWNDEKKRAAAIKRYQDYDRDHAAR